MFGEDACMRRILFIAGVVALSATAVAVAGIEPTTMVLRKADLPGGYTVLRANTGPLPNAKAAQGNRELIAGFKSWGRITGYSVEYQGGTKGTIGSRVDLFRARPGARSFLGWVAKNTPPNTGLTFVRREARLGDEAFVYRKDFESTVFVVVEWRYRNVAAHIGADSLGINGAIALARVQQRRIAAALR
jgi:hypothetical protein